MSLTLAVAATDPTVTFVAAGILDKANRFISDGTNLLKSAGVALALYLLLKNLMASFTVVRLITSGLLAGALVWLVSNMSSVSDSVGDEVNKPAVAVVGIVTLLPVGPFGQV
jgi:hypothetical protein